MGGQTLNGGTAASENLTLESTANATKGNVLLAPNGGKVGIGTTGPNYSLHVNGTSKVNGKFTVGGTDLNAAWTAVKVANDGDFLTGTAYRFGDPSWAHNPKSGFYYNNSTGEINLGGDYPAFKIYPSGNNTGAMVLHDSLSNPDGSANKQIILIKPTISASVTYTGTHTMIDVVPTESSLGTAGDLIGVRIQNSHKALWQTNSSATNYFAGNVGIGTTSPGSALDVKGILRLSGATSGYLGFAVPAAAGSTTYTWPSAAPVSNMVLQSDAAGNLSWVAAGGGNALTTNPLSQFAATTSAQLAGVMSDETGTGALVFASSPTLAGTPLAPTAAADTNTTQIATTAYVIGQAASTSPVMNGTAAVGTSLRYARADHVHASDTSRSPLAGSTSLTTLGTITTGTWNGTAIGAGYGGTGQTTYSIGDLLYANTTSTLAKLSAGTSGYVLKSNGAGAAPSWQVDATGMSGSGTTNYVPKFTAASTLGNSLLFDNGTNVGIGTTSPGAKLDVVGNTFALGTTDTTSNRIISLDANRNLNLRPGVDTTAGVWVRDENTNAGLRFYNAGASFIQSYTTDATTPSVLSLNASGGNVSIGPATAAETFDIANSSATPFIGISNNTAGTVNASGIRFKKNGSNLMGVGVDVGSDGSRNLWIFDYVAGTARMLIDASGNVGIGTTTPANALDIYTNASKKSSFHMGYGGTGDLFLTHNFPGMSSNIYFDSVWKYNKAGYGQAIEFDPTSGNISFRTAVSGTAGATATVTDRVIISNAGNVGIGISPSYLLHLGTDSAAKPGTSTWTIASDARLKDVRAPFSRGLEALEGIQPIYFRYKQDNALELPADKEYVGIIAQDAQKAVPESISVDEKGYLHVTNDAIIWTIFNAVKELYHKIIGIEVEAVRTSEEISMLRRDLAEKDQRVKALERKNELLQKYLCDKDPEAAFCRE